MLNVVRTTRFNRELKRMIKRGKDAAKFQKVAWSLINEEPLEPEYHDHKLRGEYVGRRECHIMPDWLLIYKLDGKDIIFERTGTHADLFD